MTLSIGIFSDVVCPWCLIGKRRLERALDLTGLRDEATIEWLPFELNPDMPPGGMERAAYRAQKFGAERSAALDAQMTALGREEGIAFAFDRILRTPSTRLAHAALVHAGRLGRGDALKDALLHAYFEAGRDVGDEAVILDLGASVGLDPGELRAALADPAIAGRVVALERKAAEIGVSGVPFFIVNGAWVVSGAQATQEWVAALTEHGLVPERTAAQ